MRKETSYFFVKWQLEVYFKQSGSRERGKSRQNIAISLDAYNDFTVISRTIRDQFTTIMQKYKSKARKEIAGTGLGNEKLTEYKQLLEDLIERYEESE